MSSFSIEANITATDNASKAIASVKKSLKDLQKVQSSFAKMPNSLFSSNSNQGIAGLAKQQNAFKMAVNSSQRILDNQVKSMQAMANAAKQYVSAMQGANRLNMNSGGNGGGWGRVNRKERFKRRAEAEVTYQGIRETGRAVRQGGVGVREGSTERTLNNIILNNPVLENKVSEEALKASSKYQNITASSLSGIGRDATFNLKDIKEFPQVMNDMGKVTSILSLVYKDAAKGADAAGKAYKAADLSGFADTAEQTKMFTMAFAKGSLASNKDLSGDAIKEAFKKMGTSRLALNEAGILDVVRLADELGGDTGNTIRQFRRSLTASNVAIKNKKAQEKAGLRIKDGGAVDGALLAENPVDWVYKHLAPKLEKQGINLDNASPADIDKMEKYLNTIGLIGAEQKLLMSILTKRSERNSFLKKADTMNVSDDKIQGLAKSDIATSQESVKSQFKNMSDAITKDFQPLYTGFMGGLADVLNSITTANSGVKGAVGAAGLVGMGIGKLAESGALHAVAAYKLITAATALTGAAATLSKGGLGGLADKIPKAGGAAAGAGIVSKAVAAGVVAGVAYGGYKASELALDIVSKNPAYFLPREEDGNVKQELTSYGGADDTTFAAAIISAGQLAGDSIGKRIPEHLTPVINSMKSRIEELNAAGSYGSPMDEFSAVGGKYEVEMKRLNEGATKQVEAANKQSESSNKLGEGSAKLGTSAGVMERAGSALIGAADYLKSIKFNVPSQTSIVAP